MKLLMNVMNLLCPPPAPGQAPQQLAFSSSLCDAQNAPQMNLQHEDDIMIFYGSYHLRDLYYFQILVEGE